MISPAPRLLFCWIIGVASLAAADDANFRPAAVAAQGFELTGVVGVAPTTHGKGAVAPAVAYLPAPGAVESGRPPHIATGLPDELPVAPVVHAEAVGFAPDADAALPVAPQMAASAVALMEEPEEFSIIPVTEDKVAGPPPAPAAPTTTAPAVGAVDLGVVVINHSGLAAVPPPGWIEPPLPRAGLLAFPGEDGIISVGSEPISAVKIQNPFDIRYIPPGTVSDVKISLRSVVLRANAGGDDRSLAYVNGRPLMRGDRVGQVFSLVSIRRREVILERAGKFYLIPNGRDTVIRLTL